MADQIKIRRRQRKDTIMTLTRDNLKALNAATVAAVSNPQPYINNLNNLNLLCKQIAAQQTGDLQQDLENQQPLQYSPPTSFHLPQLTSGQITTTTSGVFLPAAKIESPQLVSSPLSTIGTEMSLSPQQFPRANSFDLGLLSNLNGVPQHQLLSAALNNNHAQSDLKQQQVVPSSSSSGFELTPPQSAGLISPVPVNPTQSGNQVSYGNLVLLSQLLAQQQPVVSTAAPSLLQFVNPQQPSLQDILSLVNLLQQSGQQMSPPPVEEKSPHKPNNGFIDVCSV